MGQFVCMLYILLVRCTGPLELVFSCYLVLQVLILTPQHTHSPTPNYKLQIPLHNDQSTNSSVNYNFILLHFWPFWGMSSPLPIVIITFSYSDAE